LRLLFARETHDHKDQCKNPEVAMLVHYLTAIEASLRLLWQPVAEVVWEGQHVARMGWNRDGKQLTARTMIEGWWWQEEDTTATAAAVTARGKPPPSPPPLPPTSSYHLNHHVNLGGLPRSGMVLEPRSHPPHIHVTITSPLNQS